MLQKNDSVLRYHQGKSPLGRENATDEDLVRVCRLAQADEFIQTFPDKYDTYIEQGGTKRLPAVRSSGSALRERF